MTYQPSAEFLRLYRQGRISPDDYDLVTSFKDGWVPKAFERDIIKRATR